MLQDLQDAKTTSQRERAMGHFERYIAKHKPEFYDDDVRQILTGEGALSDDGVSQLPGLLFWCGQKSEGAKHAGMLKRSSATCIALVKWLVSFDFGDGEENIFLATFLSLPVEAYAPS